MNPSDSAQRPLCRGGCGFFGDVVSGYCSLCAKKHVTSSQPAGAPAPSSSQFLGPPKGTYLFYILLNPFIKLIVYSNNSNRSLLLRLDYPLISYCVCAIVSEPIPIRGSASSSSPSDDTGGLSVSPSPSSGSPLSSSLEKGPSARCGICKKKLGLLGFRCRCDGQFCSVHRYSDQHECSFDYKSKGRDELTKANPVIVSPKLDKI